MVSKQQPIGNELSMAASSSTGSVHCSKLKTLTTGIPQEMVEAHVLDGTPMIRAWREHLGITQAELAQRMNITQAAIAKFEKPGARPRRTTLNQIAAALGITPAQLAG